MAKVKLHPLVQELHGTFNGAVFKRSPRGDIIVSKRPDMSRVKWSKAQKEHRRRFKIAVATVRAALADPKVRLRYERRAKKQHKRAWDLAMSDHFKGKTLLPKR